MEQWSGYSGICGTPLSAAPVVVVVVAAPELAAGGGAPPAPLAVDVLAFAAAAALDWPRLLVALILLMALPRLPLVARSNAAPPLYFGSPDAVEVAAVVLELLSRLARSADEMEGERPLMLAVMLPLRSASAAEVPGAVDGPATEVVVRVLDVDRLLPFRLATIPPPAVEDVDGLRRLVASIRGGSSPILPW